MEENEMTGNIGRRGEENTKFCSENRGRGQLGRLEINEKEH
jgi:hypothetical protein